MSAWRDALRRLRISLVAKVWVGVLVLAGLGVLWLQIPDSHVWEFCFSLLSAGVMVGLFFGMCRWVFGSVLEPAGERGRWWVRWALLAAVIVVWWLLQWPIDRLMEHRYLYAGYWTSRLPYWLRGLRTREHLIVLQTWIYFSLSLMVAGLLLPGAVVASAGQLRAVGRHILGVWARWWYWVAVLVCGWIAFAVGGKLMGWTPVHGLAGEMLSVFVRLGVVFTLDVFLVCFVLGLVAVGLQRDEVSPVV